MRERAALVAIVENADGSVTIHDANGGLHHAKNAPALWLLLKQIMADPTVPNYEQAGQDQVDLENAAAEYLGAALPPGLDRLAKPFVRSGLKFLQDFSAKHPSSR